MGCCRYNFQLSVYSTEILKTADLVQKFGFALVTCLIRNITTVMLQFPVAARVSSEGSVLRKPGWHLNRQVVLKEELNCYQRETERGSLQLGPQDRCVMSLKSIFLCVCVKLTCI